LPLAALLWRARGASAACSPQEAVAGDLSAGVVTFSLEVDVLRGAEWFVTHLLSRNIRFEADLVDQLFNSSEKRLARILLLLAHFGKESRAEPVLPRINQEHLAQMVGTTRSRVSHFMMKFKTLGFIDYASGVCVIALRSILLADNEREQQNQKPHT
jgi:hypothetical protein